MYSNTMTIEQLARKIAVEIMELRGFGPYSPGDLEWDEDEDDSQISLIKEDVAQVLEILDSSELLVDLRAIE